jgi:hypothetical protein
MQIKTRCADIENETVEERAERRSFERDFTSEIPGAGDIQCRIREAVRAVPLDEPSLAERDASAELRAELMEYAFGWFSERKATLDETALISRSCAMLAHRLTVANERAATDPDRSGSDGCGAAQGASRAGPQALGRPRKVVRGTAGGALTHAARRRSRDAPAAVARHRRAHRT